MKIRSREINIISMSALDMFCSALGAFMFLTLLFISFAPNLGPEAKDVEKLREQVKQTAKELAQTKTERDKAVAELDKTLKADETDIAIVIDTTGSMASSIDRLKAEIAVFAAVLNRLTTRTRISIVDYKDRCLLASGQRDVNVLPLTLADSDGLATIQAFANGLTIQSTCNPDDPESIAAGVHAAVVDLQWTAPPANRYVIVIGDNPPYPEQASMPEEDARRWAEKGGKLSTLFVGGNPVAEGFYRRLAQGGGGRFLNDEGGSFALSLLMAMSQ